MVLLFSQGISACETGEICRAPYRQPCNLCTTEFGLPGVEKSASFRLTVCLHSASIPVLGKPGWFMRQQPVAEACLGDDKKETQPAVFVESSSSSPCSTLGRPSPSGVSNAALQDRPWLFGRGAGPGAIGETLAFEAGLPELLGGATLRLQLSAYTDIEVASLFSFELAPVAALGEVAIDLRHGLLPACALPDDALSSPLKKGPWWTSPVLVLPFSPADPGMPTAHVALTLAVSRDPTPLLELVGVAELACRLQLVPSFGCDGIAEQCDDATVWAPAWKEEQVEWERRTPRERADNDRIASTAERRWCRFWETNSPVF